MLDRYCLVTGASGFVGSALLAEMRARGLPVRGAARSPSDGGLFDCGEIGPATDWRPAVAGADTVVHAAACVHMRSRDPADFHRINVEGTERLAGQAAAAGVRRFVFLSSLKANGEATKPGRPFTEEDEPAPEDPYGESKARAERCLRELARATGMEVVIIRPPLVYGPGVKANFESMMRWLERGLPLPLGAVENRRSLIALPNLVDFVIVCLTHPQAANQTFLVSDGDDLSTTELLRRTAEALGRRPRLVPLPGALLVGAATVLGQRSKARRLLGSLQASSAKARNLLDWVPPVSVDEGLLAAARDFSTRPRS